MFFEKIFKKDFKNLKLLFFLLIIFLNKRNEKEINFMQVIFTARLICRCLIPILGLLLLSGCPNCQLRRIPATFFRLLFSESHFIN